MILDSVVFGAWGHATWLEITKGESSDIILVDLDVQAGRRVDGKV